MSGFLRSLGFLGSQFLGGLVDLIYPGACWVCERFDPNLHESVCSSCRQSLVTDPFPTCPRCSSTVGPFAALQDGCSHCREESFAFDHALRMAPYDGLLREVVLRMKQASGEGLAEAIAPLWVECVVHQLTTRFSAFQPTLVVSIPAHWTRYWQRTYNPPDVFARRLAQRLGLPCHKILRRRRRTVRLATLAPTVRRQEIKGAFEPNTQVDLTDQTVILVDDVLTTGATAHEAARVLKKMKASQILAAVLAHGR